MIKAIKSVFLVCVFIVTASLAFAQSDEGITHGDCPAHVYAVAEFGKALWVTVLRLDTVANHHLNDVVDHIESQVISHLNHNGEYLKQHGINPDTIYKKKIRQPLIEMATNAFEWGNRFRPGTRVIISVRFHDKALVITIRDEGDGFNQQYLPHAAQVDDPIAHLDEREKLGIRDGGFGLMITRGMVSELRHNNKGNQVAIIWKWDELTTVD